MTDKNPWTILGQRDVYDNPWINLTEYQVLNPAGGEGIYGKVHFKNRAIGIFPLDSIGNTWLVGQYRFTINQYCWEMPEGGGPMNEDPLDAAKRELSEETGLLAADWSLLLTMHLTNSVTDEYALIYLARNLEQRQAHPEETEDLRVWKLPFAEVYRMVEAGEITDSMTVAAVQKIQLMLLDGRIKFKL